MRGVSAVLAAEPRRLNGTIAMLACAAKQTSIDPQKARRHRQKGRHFAHLSGIIPVALSSHRPVAPIVAILTRAGKAVR